MLEGESSVGSCIEPENGPDSMSSSEGEKIRIIDWSPTGRAFRITDVSAFSSLILPKYFRTNNFSSFQRNLNLYGFSKVRRGPDADMYAHPSFMRGRSDKLSQLRKCKSAADRKRLAAANVAIIESQFMLAPRPSTSEEKCSSKPRGPGMLLASIQEQINDDPGRVVSPSPSISAQPSPTHPFHVSSMPLTSSYSNVIAGASPLLSSATFASIAPASSPYQMSFQPLTSNYGAAIMVVSPQYSHSQPQSSNTLPEFQSRISNSNDSNTPSQLTSAAVNYTTLARTILPKPPRSEETIEYKIEFTSTQATPHSKSLQLSKTPECIHKSCSAQSLNNLALALISLGKC